MPHDDDDDATMRPLDDLYDSPKNSKYEHHHHPRKILEAHQNSASKAISQHLQPATPTTGACNVLSNNPWLNAAGQRQQPPALLAYERSKQCHMHKKARIHGRCHHTMVIEQP
jgi:hypothetical protein